MYLPLNSICPIITDPGAWGFLWFFLLGLAFGVMLGRRLKPNRERRKTFRISSPPAARSRKNLNREGNNSDNTAIAVPEGMVEIYVGNLSYEMTEDQLRREFEAYGQVHSARVITHRMSRRSKGFGFVVMPSRDEAQAAIDGLSERDVMGRKMRVNEARDKYRRE